MISFKDIELKDKELITSYTQQSPRRNCDLSFSNLCSWRFLYDTQFAVQDGFLVLKFWAGEKLVYMMPVGSGDLKKVLEDMIEDANQEGERFCMLGVCAGKDMGVRRLMEFLGNFISKRTGIMPTTYIFGPTLPHWPVKNSKLNETTSINSVGPIPIMNMFLSLPTVYRNVSIWKPNGAK